MTTNAVQNGVQWWHPPRNEVRGPHVWGWVPNGGAAKMTRRRRTAKRAAGCVCVRVAEVAAAARRGWGPGGLGPGCLPSPLCRAGLDTQSGRSGTPGVGEREWLF